MTHLVYKTTNTLTQEYYIGVHTCNCSPACRYQGSGRALKANMSQYPDVDFETITLGKFFTRDKALRYEKSLIDLSDPLCLNLINGGSGVVYKSSNAASKPVVLDGVEYISQRQAAKALGVSPLTVNRWVKGKHTRGRKGSGKNNYNVVTPQGTFPSLTKSALGCKLPVSTLQHRIISKSFSEYYKA